MADKGCRIDDYGRECARCWEYKPWSEFHKDKSGTLGRHAWCKKCKADHAGSSFRRVDLHKRDGRRCSRCKKFKPWSEFFESKSGTSGHHSQCKECYFETEGYRTHKNNSITNEGRECSLCKKFKRWDKFYSNKSGTHGHSSRCKECSNKTHHTPSATRRNHLKCNYGLTVEQYEKMLEKQGGTCAVCGQKESTVRNGKVSLLSVDHDHKTGEVRGLLCGRCNRLLGDAQDNIALLQKAIAYLKKADTYGSHDS